MLRQMHRAPEATNFHPDGAKAIFITRIDLCAFTHYSGRQVRTSQTGGIKPTSKQD